MAAMSKLNALLVQAQLNWKDPAMNRRHLQSMISGAPGNFDLVVLPELLRPVSSVTPIFPTRT